MPFDPSIQDDTLLEEIHDRFGRAVIYETENRSRAYRDVLFLDGQHWPGQVKKDREQDGRGKDRVERREARRESKREAEVEGRGERGTVS